MRSSLIVAAFVSFVIYGLAINKVFSRDHGIDWRMRGLQVGGTACALIHLGCLWFAHSQVSVQSLASLTLYAAGIVCFFAAKGALGGHRLTLAFSPDTPIQMISAGVYARVRHPFYLAYVLTWMAGAVGAPSIATISTASCMAVAYVGAARLEERKFAASRFQTAYEQYKDRAGMLWPRW